MNIEQKIQNILDRNFTRGDNANALKELLVLYNVVGRSEQLFCPHCGGGQENFTRNGNHIWCQKCDYEFNVG